MKIRKKIIAALLMLAFALSPVITMTVLPVTVEAKASSRETDLYQTIEAGVLNQAGVGFDGKNVKEGQYIDISSFALSADNSEDRALVYRIYRQVYYDHPECFWLKEGIYRYQQNGRYAGVIPMVQDGMTSKKIAAKTKKMDKAVRWLVSQVKKEKDPVQRLLVLHDELATSIRYNADVAQGNETKASGIAWTSLGALVDHDAVCKGTAMAFKLVIDRLEDPRIQCLVTGSDEMNHVWNMVCVNGTWYHVDVNQAVTDYSLYNRGLTHKRFLLSDAKMKSYTYRGWADSMPYETPVCSSTRYDNVQW